MGKIDKFNRLTIEDVPQRCMYNKGDCGTWCPRCYIVNRTSSNFGGPISIVGKSIVTCGQTVDMEES